MQNSNYIKFETIHENNTYNQERQEPVVFHRYIKHLIGEGCLKNNCGIRYLADSLGYSLATIYRWQNGEAVPNAAALIRLIRFAGYEVPAFIN